MAAEAVEQRAIAAAADAALPRSLASLRCLRQLLSVSFRSVGNDALPLPDLQLALLPPGPPADAQVELGPRRDGSVRVRVGARALAAPNAEPLHVTTVARETLNPTWQLDGSALAAGAQRLGAARFVLRQHWPGPPAELLCTEVRLSSLVHVVERRSGGSVGVGGFDGLVGGLALLPPYSLVIELDVGGGARRTFSTLHALAPMAAAGLLVRLGPPLWSPRAGTRGGRPGGGGEGAGGAEGGSAGEGATAAEGAGGAEVAGGANCANVTDGAASLVGWLDRWAEAEALPRARAAAAVEALNASEALRLEQALRSRERIEARRVQAAGEAAELAVLRRAAARERDEVAAARRAVGEARSRADAHAASASLLAAAAATARAEAARRSAAAESRESTQALGALRQRRAAALRAAVLSLGRLLPCAMGGSSPTLCGLRVGGRDEETSSVLGLAAMSVGALGRMAGERLGLFLLLRGSRSAVREEEEAKPLPLHGKGAEAGPGARLLLRSTRRLVASVCAQLGVEMAPAAEAASAGAGVLLLLAGVYEGVARDASPLKPVGASGDVTVGTAGAARHAQTRAQTGGAHPALLGVPAAEALPVRAAGGGVFFGQAAPLVDMPD